MLFLRSFINLFMVPVITLAVFYRNNKADFKPTFELLIKYSIIVSLNIPLTRVFTLFAKTLTGLNIEADSSYYTVCALVAAVVMAYGWEYCLKAKADIDEKKNAKSKTLSKE